MAKNDKVVKFDRGFTFNIGVFITLIIILYVAFHIFSSITKKEVTAYNVTLGTIVEKNFYQGMAIRQEEIVVADKSGEVFYYEPNRSRIGVRSVIYSVDTKGDLVNRLKNSTKDISSISSSELKKIYPRIESFMGEFSEVSFLNTYSFKSDVENFILDELLNDTAVEYTDEIVNAKNAGTYFEYNSNKPGFLVYTVDGYEDKTIESIVSEDFNAGGISTTNLRLNTSVNAGDPAYKLILSDDWKIVVPIDSEKANELGKLETIQIRFTQDNASTWAYSEVTRINGDDYLVLSLDDSMERYASQRFVNIELLLDEKEGLKIPNSSICEKEFYLIPKSYFSLGGNSNSLGIILRRGGLKDEFITPSIYYENNEYYYIDNEFVSAGDKIIMEQSSDVYTVGGKTDSLFGVYNINKGYAIFKSVDVIYKNEEYTIVRNQAPYSISLYDYIVLDANSVKENEIL